MSIGTVYLVGAGPGDPGLITVRGAELLGKADVVIYDHLASPRLLRCAKPDAKLVYAGKEASAHTLNQDAINAALVEHARAGRMVVRLKGGDPFVFGRGGEEAMALAEAGVPFEVVPGITAGIAGPAYAGIPVTHRGLASNLVLVTGHETPDKEESGLDYEALAKLNGTLAFYMSVGNLDSICSNLIARGLPADTPAALVHWGTTPAQQVLTGTAGDITAKVREANVRPPAIILIGKVVALREKLNWFERRPMFGQCVVVTRARAQASDLADELERLGAEVIELPTIRIETAADPEPLRTAVRNLRSFDWIIFTSVNAVDAFFATLAEAGLDARALAPCRIATIGPATAQRLSSHGLRSDAQPPKFTGAAVVEHLAAQEDLRGKRILCPRADIAPSELVDAIAVRGVTVTEVEAYRTVPDNANATAVLELLEQGREFWITFTSSSTVNNFFAAVETGRLAGKPVRLASIGPSTSATLAKFGFSPTVEAQNHTIPGLIAAILGGIRTV